jgi:peroxiredoxin
MRSDNKYDTPEIFGEMTTNLGNNVQEMSLKNPILLVFLRHFGCAFCRASLIELAKKRPNYQKIGIKIVFVHMTDYDTAENYFDKYNLSGSEHVSDPDCRYYSGFGIVKGTMTQLFGFTSLMKGFSYAFKKDLGWGRIIGDGFQMPGLFLTHEGVVKEKFVYKTVSDEPDYDKIVACCVTS